MQRACDCGSMSEATLGHGVHVGESEGFETWTLDSGDGGLRATFAPKAGMVGCSLSHAGEELLHLERGLRDYVRTGAVIGIPLLHPWANRLAALDYDVAGRTVSLDRDSPLLQLDPNGLPIHGLLAGSPHWAVRAVPKADGAALSAELDFGAREELLAGFPFPHVLRMDVLLRGADLTIQATLTPTGDEAVPVSFGFHPYLRLPGAAREGWEVELPVRRRLVLDGRMIPTGEVEEVRLRSCPLGKRGFDDGFTDLVPGRPFTVAGGGRKVAVAFLEGYRFAQVYSPPGAQFICFEPMTAPTNALLAGGAALPLAQPGSAYRATFRIGVATTSPLRPESAPASRVQASAAPAAGGKARSRGRRAPKGARRRSGPRR
jgi:galactose mutarotase-like enzyme